MIAVIGLGSNLGSREAILQTSVNLLGSLPSSRVEAVSALYETEAIGPPQPRYLNAAVRLATLLSPLELLGLLLRVESILGRERKERYVPRTIDLDLLWTDGPAVSLPSLVVPHPRLRERVFALVPLLDVVPELGSLYTEDLQRLRSEQPLVVSGAAIRCPPPLAAVR